MEGYGLCKDKAAIDETCICSCGKSGEIAFDRREGVNI
jgi:hypothetical protein